VELARAIDIPLKVTEVGFVGEPGSPAVTTSNRFVPAGTVNELSVLLFVNCWAAVPRAVTGVGAGAVTVNVLLAVEAGAKFPAVSLDVPDAMLMPSVPTPVILLMVTVRVLPLPETPTVPLAVPVVLSVILLVPRVLALKFVSL
jgi:hypothetical protein